MKRLILHIGLPHTGSGALYHFLSLNRYRLEAQKVRLLSDWPKNGNAAVKSLALTRLQETADTVLVSDPTLYNQMVGDPSFRSELCQLVELLKNKNIATDALVYLRRQDEWLYSMWKCGTSGDVSGAMDAAGFRVYIGARRAEAEYTALCSRLEAVFGIAHLHIRPYVPHDRTGSALFSDFIQAAGLQWDNDFTIPIKPIRPSLTAEAAEVLRYYPVWQNAENALSPERLYAACAAVSTLDPEELPVYPLPPEERRSLIASFYEGNRSISEKFLNGAKLFHETFEPYRVWQSSGEDALRKRCGKAAKLATIPPEKTEILLYSKQASATGESASPVPGGAVAVARQATYIVDEKRHLAYLENNKVACTSIKSSFIEDPLPDNATYSIHPILRQRGMECHALPNRDALFVFSFVRNPFSRLVSCYEEKYRTHGPDDNRHWFYAGLNEAFLEDRGFDAFVRLVCETPDDLMDPHFCIQYDVIFAPDGRCRCDFVGRYETLAVDFEKLRCRFGLKTLPHFNPSAKVDWRDYYNAELIDLVSRKFERDLLTFGYRRP